jgi:hypothetical protein
MVLLQLLQKRTFEPKTWKFSNTVDLRIHSQFNRPSTRAKTIYTFVSPSNLRTFTPEIYVYLEVNKVILTVLGLAITWICES